MKAWVLRGKDLSFRMIPDGHYYVLKLPLFDTDVFVAATNKKEDIESDEIICMLSLQHLKWNNNYPFKTTITVEQLDIINRTWDELLNYNQRCLKK